MTNEQFNKIFETYEKSKKIFVKSVKENISEELKNTKILDINIEDFHFWRQLNEIQVYGSFGSYSIEELEDENTLIEIKTISDINPNVGVTALKNLQNIVNDKFNSQQLNVILKYLEKKECEYVQSVNAKEQITTLILKCYRSRILKRTIPTNWTGKEISTYILATGDLPQKKQALKIVQEHEKG